MHKNRPGSREKRLNDALYIPRAHAPRWICSSSLHTVPDAVNHSTSTTDSCEALGATSLYIPVYPDEYRAPGGISCCVTYPPMPIVCCRSSNIVPLLTLLRNTNCSLEYQQPGLRTHPSYRICSRITAHSRLIFVEKLHKVVSLGQANVDPTSRWPWTACGTGDGRGGCREYSFDVNYQRLTTDIPIIHHLSAVVRPRNYALFTLQA